MVPFTGASPAVAAVRGNHVEAVILALGTMTGHLRSGAVRGLAISSKVSDFPDIPTLAELGYTEPLFDVWTAFFAPGTVDPKALIASRGEYSATAWADSKYVYALVAHAGQEALRRLI